MRLWKVFYETEKQKSIVREAINFAFNDQNQPPAERAPQAADAIQFFIPTFKNEGFSEEKECRLIFTPSPGFDKACQFRVSRGMLVPYYTLQTLFDKQQQLDKLPLIGVRVGPSANRRLNVESAVMVLDQAGYGHIPVDSSSTPYRG
jgi:hypothetical protein